MDWLASLELYCVKMFRLSLVFISFSSVFNSVLLYENMYVKVILFLLPLTKALAKNWSVPGLVEWLPPAPNA